MDAKHVSERPVVIALLLGLLAACTSAPSADRESNHRGPSAAQQSPRSAPQGERTCRTVAHHQQRFRIRVGGVERSYLLSVAGGVGPRPLVVVFHGFRENAAWMDRYTRLPRAGVAAGFAVATPDGYKEQWNFPRRHRVGPDDVRFVRAMIRTIGESVCLDRRDVFVTGFSDGADMADTIACVDPEIRAVAGVAASVPVRNCVHSVDVLQFHGDADPVVPFEGGGGDRPPPYEGEEARSVAVQMAAWRHLDGCSPARTAQVRRRGGIGQIRSLACESRRSVLLIVLHGGGHTWPGASFDLPFGATNRALSATTRVLYFFDQLVGR